MLEPLACTWATEGMLLLDTADVIKANKTCSTSKRQRRKMSDSEQHHRDNPKKAKHTRVRRKYAEFDSCYSWVVLGCTWVCGAVSLGFGFSSGVYLDPFTERFPSDKKWISGILSAQIGFLYGMGPFAAIVTMRYGARAAVFCGATFCTGGFLAASFSESIWHLFIGFSVLAGTGQAFLYNVGMSLATCWFKKHLLFAGGISTSAVSVGVSLGGYTLKRLITMYDWRTACMAQACVCAQLFIAAALIRKPPMDGENVDGEEVVKPTKEKGILQVFISLLVPKFFMYCLAMILWGTSQVFFYIYVMKAHEYALGENAVLLLPVLSASDVTVRMLSGAFANYMQIHPGYSYFVGIVLNGVIVLLTPAMVGPVISYVHAVVFGATQGIFVGVAWTTLNALFKETPLTAAFGLAMFICGAGTFTAGPIAELLLVDDAITPMGEYGRVFGTFGSVILLSSVIFLGTLLMDFRQRRIQCWGRSNSDEQIFSRAENEDDTEIGTI